MARTGRRKPGERVEDWPRTVSPHADVEVARRLAQALGAALEERHLTLRAAAALTGVGYTSIGDLLRGHTWPDLATIANLEAGLDVDLWPAGVAREAGVLGGEQAGPGAAQ